MSDIFKPRPAPLTYHGPITLLGGFLLHLVLGAFYLWGALNIYVTSYYRIIDDPTLSLDLTGGIFPVMGLFLNGSMFFGLIIAEKVGFRVSMLAYSILLPVLVFISSYMPNFWLFALFYGVLFGIVAGLTYMLPVHIGFSHFPNKRGLVTGVIVAGFGCGVLVSNNIVLAIINPDNVTPTIFD